MVKKLKLRFILIAALAMAITLGVAFAVVNLTLRNEVTERTDYIIDLIYKNGGEFPSYEKYYYGLHSQTAYETRYYVAVINKQNVVIGLNSEHIYFPDSTELTDQLTDIIRLKKERGYIDDYRFGVFKSDYGKMVVVVDCKTDRMTNDMLLKITVYTVTICIVLVIIILAFFSGVIVKPFVKNREKQKQFITDAGHELKTPIAIISANTEVLEMTEGENEWLTNIKSQTVRLNSLVRNMIDLSKMDEQGEKAVKESVNLSDIVNESISSFSVICESESISVKSFVEPDIEVLAQSENMIRLVGILIDNAIKYVDERKEIVVSLTHKGKKVLYKVTNTCKGVEKTKLSHFFDRFYRADKSRNSKKGGYGIGLSMAKAICEREKFKIYADYTPDERVVMTIEI